MAAPGAKHVQNEQNRNSQMFMVTSTITLLYGFNEALNMFETERFM